MPVPLRVTCEKRDHDAVLTANVEYRYPTIWGRILAVFFAAGLLWLALRSPSTTARTGLAVVCGYLFAPIFVRYVLAPITVRATLSGGILSVDRCFGGRLRSSQSLEPQPDLDFRLAPRTRVLGMDLVPGDSIMYGDALVRIPLTFRGSASELRDHLNEFVSEYLRAASG